MAITEKDIERINELYHKSKTEAGLTAEELQEQKTLRENYIKSIRASLRGNLDNIDVVEEDGSITNLGEQNRKKHEE